MSFVADTAEVGDKFVEGNFLVAGQSARLPRVGSGIGKPHARGGNRSDDHPG